MVVKNQSLLVDLGGYSRKRMVVKTKHFWLISVVTPKKYGGWNQTDLVNFGGYSKKVWWLKPNRFGRFRWLLQKSVVVKTKQILLISVVTPKKYGG